jgi:hypothetical protein
VISSPLAELGEISVSLPPDASPQAMQDVADELEPDGYMITSLGFNGRHEIRVAALGWQGSNMKFYAVATIALHPLIADRHPAVLEAIKVTKVPAAWRLGVQTSRERYGSSRRCG